MMTKKNPTPTPAFTLGATAAKNMAKLNQANPNKMNVNISSYKIRLNIQAVLFSCAISLPQNPLCETG